MGTSREKIRSWLQRGIEKKAIYMMVGYDSFDYEDYPIYCYSLQEAKEKYKQQERVMECYDLTLNLEAQLKEYRSWHPSESILGR